MSSDRKLEIKQEEDQSLSIFLPPPVQQIALDYVDSDIDVNSKLRLPNKGLKLFNADQNILAILANRLQLDKNKRADLRTLLLKYPCAIDDNKELADKLFPGVHQTTVNSLADYYVLWGELDELKLLIQKYPHLLNTVTEARDPAGRKIQGTLYQKALGAGDFEMAAMLKTFLKPEEESKQYREQFPEDWEKEAKKKLAANLKAFGEVWKAIRDADPMNLKIECKEALDTFKTHLLSENETPITSGYHFDLEFLLKAAERFQLKIDEISHLWVPSSKEYLFWQQVFGSMQLRVSACDQHKQLQDFDEKKPVHRTLKINDGISIYQRSTHGFVIGENSCIDVWGVPNELPTSKMGANDARWMIPRYQKMFAARKAAQENFRGEQAVEKTESNKESNSRNAWAFMTPRSRFV